MGIIGGHSSPYFLSHSGERLKGVTISTRRHAVHLYFWLRIFLRWEVAEKLGILCQVPCTEPHGLHGSENERWKNGVYDGFYCSFMSIRAVG